jgi:excisionase family DNA binding protein
MNQLLSIPLFCKEYAVSRSTAYRLLASGQLVAVKIGKSTRVRSDDAERWAASLSRYHPAVG